MSDPVTIAVKSTADTSGIKEAGNALESLGKKTQQAASDWEHMGKRISKKFSLPDIGKEVLNGLGIGSGFALAERLSGLIVDHFKEAAEYAKTMADESDRALAAWEKSMSLRNTDVQNLALLKQKQAAGERAYDEANKPKQITVKVGSVIRGEDFRREETRTVAPTEKEQAKIAELKRENEERLLVIKQLELAIKAAADAERALIAEDTRYAQEVKKINDLVGEGGLTRAEADKRIAQLATERRDKETIAAEERAKAQLDEADKIEEAHKRIATALKTSAEKYRDLADPQRKYKQQLAEIDLASRTYLEAGKPLLTQQEAAAAKARILAEMNDTAGKAIRATRVEVEAYDIALEQLDKNPQLSDQEKQRERIRLIDEQTAAINRAKKSLQDFMAANPGVDVGGLTAALEQLGNKTARNAGLRQPAQTLGQRDDIGLKDLTDPSKHDQSITGGLLGGLKEFYASLATAGDRARETILSLGQALQGGIRGSIEGLINRTMTWGGALRNIGTTIVSSIISSFANMAASWITKQIMMALFGRALQAATLAAQLPLAMATTAMWAPAATAASIATFGAAAIEGAAMAQGAIVASAFNFAADGAIVRGPGGPRDDKIPFMLSNGEAVTRAASVSRFGEGFFNALNAGVLDLSALPDSIARQLPAAAAAPRFGGGSADGSGAPAAAGGNIHLAFHNTEADAVQSLKGREGRRFLVDFINKTVRDMS